MELTFYKLPFTNYEGRVYDANSNFVFQFVKVTENTEATIMDILNDEKIVHSSHRVTISNENTGLILIDDIPAILIRGWGNLTGTGAHNFSHDKATKIQDDFRDWIIYKLTNVQNGMNKTNT